MFIDRLISISANSAGLNSYLSQQSNIRLIVPSSKLASYAHGLGFKEVLLYQDLINLEPKVATKSQLLSCILFVPINIMFELTVSYLLRIYF